MIISEKWIGKNVDRNGHGLILGSIPKFGRTEENAENFMQNNLSLGRELNSERPE
jgi:hypothetical protein